MKRDIKSMIAGFLCLLVLGLMLAFCMNQPNLMTGFRITTSDFTVVELFDDSPAYNAGLAIDDRIVRIDSIDTEAFAARYYGGRQSDWYMGYAKLFKTGAVYELELADGSVHYLDITEKTPFLGRFRLLSIDDKVGYSVGILFVILGFLLSFFSDEEFDKSAFVNFLYAIGICLANAYTDTHNMVSYSVCNLVLFHLSTAGIASSVLRIVGFFYRLAGRQRAYGRLNAISYVPYILVVIRGVVTAFYLESFFDSMLFYLPYLNLSVLIYGIVSFCCLMYIIPPQSSPTLRFMLTGLLFSLVPVVFIVAIRSFSSSIAVASTGESLKTFLPLLFIPVSLLCCFIQAKKVKCDKVISRVMIIGCSSLILLVLLSLPVDSIIYRGVLIVLAAFICFILEKPILNFLYPQIECLTDSFSALEKMLFSCDTESDMYTLVADWLNTALNPGFIVFYEIPDNENGISGRTLYKECANQARADACLVSLIADRCAETKRSDEVIIHGNWGISAPIYKSHHVFGYVFLGARNHYEMFSIAEINLLQPTARILMEALLVFDLKQQVEYINNMQNRIVYSFADMIESRDGTTGQHVKRTSLVVDLLTKYLKKKKVYADTLYPDDYALISLAAPLHDIGKIKVPDRILSKPGKLTDEEFAIIKTHPVVGEKIINKTMFKIEDARYLKIAREMALYHHEKWNGTGYPEKLRGKKIPISARIMAVADVFDALCSARSYKKAFTIEEAFKIIDESSGTHFEPVLVDAMHALENELTEIYGSEGIC